MTSFGEYIRTSGKNSISTFGDSVTAGASVPEQTRWANRLATQFSLLLRNRGISGTVLQNSFDATGAPRADNGASRYRHALLGPERSDLIAILYGTNDARHTGAPATLNRDSFIRDYRLVLTDLIDSGFAPRDICIGSPVHLPDAGFAVGDSAFTGQSRAAFEAYVDTVRGLAREFGTYYAPVNERMQTNGADTLVLPDQVHPNPQGHRVIADAFAQAMILD